MRTDRRRGPSCWRTPRSSWRSSARASVIAIVFFRGPVEEKHLADADDSCLYWYFLVASGLATYLLVYVSPRLG